VITMGLVTLYYRIVLSTPTAAEAAR